MLRLRTIMMRINEEGGMLEEAHVFESLPAYALGSLEGAEARVVGEHLAGCLVCRRELQAYEGVAGQLALAAPDAKVAGPPAALKGQLMERVGRLQGAAESRPVTQERGRWLRLRPVWGVATVLLMVGLAAVNLLLWQQLNSREVLTSPQGMRAVTLQSSEVAPQASGFVIIGGDGQNGVLVVDAMPQLETDKEYQLWLIR